MTQLNVPGSSGVEGPIAVYELVPTSAIATDQGAFNIYKVEIGGSVAVLLDNRQGSADLMVQFFLQNSPIGQPFVYFLQAGEREVFNLKSPIDFMVLSNMSGTYPLPLGFAQLVTQRQPQATTGYILISGMDSEFDLSSPNVPAQQVPIDHGTVASAGTITKRESVPPDANSLIVLLSNPTNVIELKVVGVTTGTTYIDVGLGVTNPAGAVNAVPIGAAYDAQVDVTVTQQAGPTLSWWLIGRQDFPNEEVTLASGATINIGGGTVNATVSGNVGITAGSTISVNGSNITVTGGNIINTPVGTAQTSASGQRFLLGNNVTFSTICSIAPATRVRRMQVSCEARNVLALTANTSYLLFFHFQLVGHTSLKTYTAAQVLGSFLTDANGNAALTFAPFVLDLDLDMGTAFNAGETVDVQVNMSSNPATGSISLGTSLVVEGI